MTKNFWIEFWKNYLPQISYTDLVAIILITMASVFLFTKNMFIDNSVVFHDEYIYKISADRQINQALVLERQLTQLSEPMPNKLFLILYGVGSYFGSNYYIFAQWLNVIFWAMGIFVLYRLSLLSGLSSYVSVAYLGSVIFLPFSTYTKYFMPETMFFFMFCLTIYTFIMGIQKENAVAVFLSGMIIGLAFFIKPHAMFLFFANFIYLFFVNGRKKINNIIFFSIGTFLSLVLVQFLVLKSSCSTPVICAYGVAPDNFKAHVYIDNMWGFLSDLFYVGIGNSLFLFTVFGMSFVIAVAVYFPRLKLLNKESVSSETIRLLVSYIVFVTIFLVSVSILFTVLNGELGRIHSRYYFFVYPILLLVIFHIPSVHLSKVGTYMSLTLCCVAVLSFVGIIRDYSNILAVSLVSDSPELGFAFISNTILYFVAILLVGTSALTIFKTQRYTWLVGTIILLSLLSSTDVMTKQKGIFRNLYTTGEGPIAVELMIGKGQMDQTLIVGENRDIITKFLFYLSTTPNVDYLESGKSVEVSLQKFPQSSWLVTISAGYFFPDWLDCTPVGATIKVCSVAR